MEINSVNKVNSVRETGHMKIIEKYPCHLHAVLLPFFAIKQASKILPGQVRHQGIVDITFLLQF